MVSFVDSLVAPLSLINALIAACAKEKKDKVYGDLRALEEIWDEYRVYNSTDREGRE
jgi:DNA-binding MurR/RpiR family transcriptional regulator